MPTPTKLIWFGNSNSLLGNAKWSFDVVKNTLPKQDAIFCNEWHWTSSCEYADIVFPADSWAEFKLPDMTASCTNPFLLAFPTTPLERIHDTRSDYEILALTARDARRARGRAARWPTTGRASSTATRRRTCSASSRGSNATRGISSTTCTRARSEGVPLLMNARTYPRHAGWEQRQEDKPWYTPTGRLEFYRPEPEFQAAGESLPVWREPVDATFYEPNAILANTAHPSIKPRGPEELRRPRVAARRRDAPVPQRRAHLGGAQARRSTRCTEHDPAYRFVFQTPKYRWGAHSTAVDSDWIAMLFGPFGDPYRRDPRTPVDGRGLHRDQPAGREASSASRTATTPGSTPTRRTARTAAGRRTTRTTRSRGR